MNKRYKVVYFILVLIASSGLNISQDNKPAATELQYYVDAICFKGDSDTASRIDLFAVVPYQSLNFIKTGEKYSAQYDLAIKVLDSNSNTIVEKRVNRIIKEKDYISSQGGSGESDYSQTILNLPKGKYEIKVVLIDNFVNETSEKTRKVTVLKFDDYPFSISGILLLSSIEEENGKYKITPYLSDNVGDLKDGYFAFFESYNKSGRDSADFIYQIIDKDGKVIESSKKVRQFVGKNKTQLFLKIPNLTSVNQGNYNLRVIALKPNMDTIPKSEDYLAVAERSLSYFRTIFGFNISDLNKSIKQLRYIAQPSDIDYIDAGPTQDEKQRRFKEFWDKQDPSPGTDRNEAFEDYYSRIDYANKEYKSYSEGWLTDMGWVYIVYGKPMQIERSTPGTIGRKYERWTYMNNRQFTFVDNTGFGDFRLYMPTTVTDKYKYK